MEVFNEDWIVHPRNPHVFAVTRLMSHLWRKNLGNDTDMLWVVSTGDHFWDRTLTIVLSFAYIESYTRPWIAHGWGESESLKKELESGFNLAGVRDPRELPNLDGTFCSLWKDPERRSQSCLL